MSDDSFFTALEDEMEEMKSGENVSSCIDSISRQYKILKEFIKTLPPKKQPPKNGSCSRLTEELSLAENRFILKNSEIILEAETISIKDLSTNQTTVYSKRNLCENCKLLENSAGDIERLVLQYCSTTKQKIREEETALIKEIENF